MEHNNNIETRKADHIKICLQDNVQFQELTNGLEKYRFIHSCLPELDIEEIDLGINFMGKDLGAPLLISSMTGGTDQAKILNYRLAEIAQHYKLAMGVGSGRIAIENIEIAHTFAVRSLAPDIPIFANLGAVQLNYGYALDQCKHLIDLVEADALILHLNPLQECIQPHGDTNFKNLLDKIGNLCWTLPVPIVVKEVGNGISPTIAEKLVEVGVYAIDVAGAGGTSWAKVESERSDNSLQRNLGKTFAEWGIPTADCIVGIRKSNQEIPLIASGGLRNGLDIAKSLALGADIAGLAQPFLQAACQSSQAIDDLVQLLLAELSTVLFCTGNASIPELKYSNMLQKIR